MRLASRSDIRFSLGAQRILTGTRGKLRARSESRSRQRKKWHCCIGTTTTLICPGRSFSLKLCNAASVCVLSRNYLLERRRIREIFVCCTALTAPRTVDLQGLSRRKSRQGRQAHRRTNHEDTQALALACAQSRHPDRTGHHPLA
ncbi:hypothetical protein ebA4389 [Aromatoleum aromaticum EbN1]|uniref:Uncharacterized protein n=1 Tax=Aromatoleum aromaticum (strain DSM 19018 / LMG 30748 / EbN1) TaxID=76114 RepID=Q5P251_AROAE|nr:hypothetical protein ebA4389 [Aromatoleum aromaticum EbN1]